MTRSRMLLLTVCLISLYTFACSAQAEGVVLERLAGGWTVDFDKTTELPDISAEDKEKLKAAGQNGLRIGLQVHGNGTAEVTIAVPEREDQNIKAQFKILAEDEKGAFIHSITGPNGEKKERVHVTYLAEGNQKIWFADIGYPLVFVKDGPVPPPAPPAP